MKKGRKIHVVSLLGGIQKMETDELLCQREMASQTYGSQEEVMIPKEEKRRAGRNELVQINIHTTTLHKIIKDPLHNTRNPPQHSIVTYMRRELEKEHIYV